jgi:release factor glutamine methyltransferase
MGRFPQVPRLERELLLGRHLELSRAQLIANPRQLIAAPQLAGLGRDLERLQRGEPLAYVLGVRDFWDFTLTVTPAVLIPRPETETLVEQALKKIQPGDVVLDLGTGSGAVAIAIARSSPASSVTAVEASAAALAVARSNAERLNARITFRHGHWFRGEQARYQVIVANPPYVAETDPHLQALRFEPRAALTAGPEGLDDLAEIIGDAPARLCTNGWLLVEHGYDQAAAVAVLFRKAGFQDIALIRDLGRQPRVTLGRLPPVHTR